MKTNAVLRRIISALLIFLLFFAAGCAPPPEVFEEEQDERTDEPFNEDGTCYTQSALLPEGFEVDPLANPRLTVIGDALVLMSAFLLGPVYGTAAAGIGSALADLLTGYAYYAPGTLIIKGGIALIAYLVLTGIDRKLAKLPRPLRILLKAALFNTAVIAAYRLMLHLFGMAALQQEFAAMTGGWLAALLVLANVTIWMYDLAVARVFALYIRVLRPRIQKALH